MTRSSRTALMWVAAFLMVAGACGTSGGKKASTTTAAPKTTTTTTAESTTTESTTTMESTTVPTAGTPSTKPANSADTARAAAANIVASDFPSGWTGAKHSTGASSTFAKCAPEIGLETKTVAQASSDDFGRRVGASRTQANSLTRIMSSQDVARSVIAKIADPAFVACTQKLITTSGFKPGTSSGKLSAVAVPGLGDDAAGIDGKLSGVDSSTNKQALVGVSIVAIRKGDLVTVLTGASLDGTQPGDSALFAKLAQAIADRQKS